VLVAKRQDSDVKNAGISAAAAAISDAVAAATVAPDQIQSVVACTSISGGHTAAAVLLAVDPEACEALTCFCPRVWRLGGTNTLFVCVLSMYVRRCQDLLQ
jgi:hypothetical protein